MSEEKGLLRPFEAAKTLGYSPQTLAVWRMKKIVLPFVVISGGVRYRRSDIEQFIADQTIMPGEGPRPDIKRRAGGSGRPPWKHGRKRKQATR